MYIKNDDFLRWCDEDYIFNNMYSEDTKRIKKSDLQALKDYYFVYVDDLADFVEINAFTDWLHELSEEEIKSILEA